MNDDEYERYEASIDDPEPEGAEYCEIAPDERHSVGWHAGRDCSWCNERQDD